MSLRESFAPWREIRNFYFSKGANKPKPPIPVFPRHPIIIAGLLFLAACTSHKKDTNAEEKDSIPEKEYPIVDIQPGTILSDHPIKDIHNKSIDLFDTTKTNLIVFWASWCLPCWAEMPTLRKIHEEFRSNENFRMISVSLDEDEQEWRDGVKKAELPWENAIVLGEGAHSKYGIKGIPFIIIVDNQRKLIKSILGFREENEDTVRWYLESWVR